MNVAPIEQIVDTAAAAAAAATDVTTYAVIERLEQPLPNRQQ